jgi:dihydroorotase
LENSREARLVKRLSYDLVITGKIVDKKVFNASICIEDDKIVSITREGVSGRKEIKTPAYIFPGFIDAHVHLREDPSQQWSYKEDFLTGSRAAIHGGIITVADMPNTPEPASSRTAVLKKIELAKKSLIPVMFYGAVLSSNMDKLKDMADVVCGYKVYTAETTGSLLLDDMDQIEKAVEILSKTGKPIVFHCGNNLEKILKICKKHKAKTHIAHVARNDELEIIKKYKGRHVTCETCPHYLFFTAKDFKQRVKPEIGDEEDRSALMEALKNGTIDILSTDHAPHTSEDKQKGIPGFPGLDTYSNIVSWLIADQEIKPERIVELTSENPAKHLGITTGIEEGMPANLTILDMQRTTVEKKDLKTKCRWSPYEGYEFPGKAIYTIYQGKILMENGILLK